MPPGPAIRRSPLVLPRLHWAIFRHQRRQPTYSRRHARHAPHRPRAGSCPSLPPPVEGPPKSSPAGPAFGRKPGRMRADLSQPSPSSLPRQVDRAAQPFRAGWPASGDATRSIRTDPLAPDQAWSRRRVAAQHPPPRPLRQHRLPARARQRGCRGRIPPRRQHPAAPRSAGYTPALERSSLVLALRTSRFLLAPLFFAPAKPFPAARARPTLRAISRPDPKPCQPQVQPRPQPSGRHKLPGQPCRPAAGVIAARRLGSSPLGPQDRALPRHAAILREMARGNGLAWILLGYPHQKAAPPFQGSQERPRCHCSAP